MSGLINDDMFSALEVYYGKVEDYDSIARVDLLSRKKIKEWGCQERLDKEALRNIFKTGLPQEDADRYHSYQKVSKSHFIS